MNEIPLSENDQISFKKALKYSKHWSNVHHWEVGAAEMALGAELLTWGVRNGQLEIGRDFIVSKLPVQKSSDTNANATDVELSVFGTSILGSIGLSDKGRTIGIPMIVLVGGGTFLLSRFGYAVGDLAEKFLPSSNQLGGFVAGASILTLGLALIIDGARGIVKNEPNVFLGSVVAYGKIYVNELRPKADANTPAEFRAMIANHVRAPTAN